MEAFALQGSLLDGEEPGYDTRFRGIRRIELADRAWLDHVPGWVCGSSALFDELVAHAPWAEGTERIQGRDVPRPRLTASVSALEPPAQLRWWAAVGRALSDRYGVRFERIGLNLYRDGRDSVAWHGDRVARDLPTATVAIVSVGERRAFLFKPAAGGSSSVLHLGHGDLLVMGGSFQRTWRHAVPKVAAAGPRISVTFRHAYPWRAATPVRDSAR